MSFFVLKKWFSLRFLGQFLVGIIIISYIYIYYTSSISKEYIMNKQTMPTPVPAAQMSMAPVPKEQKDYSLFLEKVEKNKIFAAVSPRKSTLSSAPGREQLRKVIDNLTLVGIVSVGQPRAAIKDKKSRKSFYLKEGEEFLDGITVEKVGKSMVILNYSGETFELFL